MKGWLTSDHTAYVSPVIAEAGGEYELVIDTGFTGFLYIPEDTIANWGLQFVSTIPIVLADRTTTIVDAYEAEVTWFSAAKRVPVLAGPSGCDSLLGMQLLEGCRIELDRLNGEIRIEPL